MKKVTAFVGSARKGYTYAAAAQLLDNLRDLGNVEGEVLRLSSYHLEPCRGCRLCLDRGEELCPLQDDRDVLFEKIMASDGVIFASPNYAFHVSGIMKVFLDKFGFAFHRPRFFGKTFTSIVTQGIYGGNKIIQYLDFAGNALGFNVVKGTCLTTLDPMTEKQQHKIDRALAKQAQRYHTSLHKLGNLPPKLSDLMFFRMARTKMRLMLDESYRDYTYYRDQGWFESDFYYPTRLGPLKKGVGTLFDWMFASLTKTR